MTNKYEHCLKAVAIGDLCGSSLEGYHGIVPSEILNDDYMLYSKGQVPNRLTDDTVCTFGIAAAIMSGDFDWAKHLKLYGRCYPDVGYGGNYKAWLHDAATADYASWANGAAMRCSPIGWYATTISELEQLVEDSCKCTHNTPEAILGATVLCHAIWLAKNGASQEEILQMFEQRMPNWQGLTLNNYKQHFIDQGQAVEKFVWYLKCDNIVGMCMLAFFMSNNFEEAIKLAIGQGYDTDTAGAIVAPLAYAYYKEIPQKYLDVIDKAFDPNMKLINTIFSRDYVK